MDKILSVKQTADYLGRSRRWVYEVGIAKLGLPARKMGKDYAVSERELDKWFTSLPTGTRI